MANKIDPDAVLPKTSFAERVGCHSQQKRTYCLCGAHFVKMASVDEISVKLQETKVSGETKVCAIDS